MPALLELAADLREKVSKLRFAPPVVCTYNPLDYAWSGHEAYLTAFGAAPKRVVFLGMNPGPWGMTQTGVPFGEIASVTGWMGLRFEVRKPNPAHPKRPIEGLACRRSEVSGRRLWGLFSKLYPQAADFFRDQIVMNYCPLVWMEESGKNRTPDKLSATERAAVDVPCNAHLRAVLECLSPAHVVGVGGFAEGKLAEVSRPGDPWKISRIPHPSPANPAANRGWDNAALANLRANGVIK